MMVVVDASAVGAFLLADEFGLFAEFARSICRAELIHVPSIWPTELASLIKAAHCRGRINDTEREEAVFSAEAVRATVHIHPDRSIGTVVDHALKTGLSAYDTTYVLLSAQLDAPLLTGDGRLRRAAQTLGLKILTE